MNLNLDPARTAAESTMLDTCTVTRDGPGRRDDTFDEETLTYTAPTGDATTVYTGKCTCAAIANRGDGSSSQGGQDIYGDLWQIKIPATAAPQVGDIVTVTASAFDDELVGQEFTVVSVRGGTRAVTRTLRCVTRIRGPRT